MKTKKRKHLEEKGWKVGTTEEFLGLSKEDVAYIELKLTLADNLKKRRLQKKLTQMELAKLLESSQSRIAKMEAADSSVSLDLLIKSLLMLGSSKRDIADMMLMR